MSTWMCSETHVAASLRQGYMELDAVEASYFPS